MSVFHLKRSDTRPILEVALKNPDGSIHNLTGSTGWKLHVRLSATSVFTRNMVKEGLDTAGVLRYAWVAADWDVPGGLPLVATLKHQDLSMEYEVIAGSSRLTFPNAGYDTLRILSDLG